jgi:hypothetical protein
MPDDAWLRAVSAFGETHARVARTASSESDGRPIAVLLLSAEGN